MRLYSPKPEALDSRWKAPPLQPAGQREKPVNIEIPAFASPTRNAMPVIIDNFIRADSDLYLGNRVKDGSFGKFTYRREPASVDSELTLKEFWKSGGTHTPKNERKCSIYC
jgi:hypothetical protein